MSWSAMQIGDRVEAAAQLAERSSLAGSAREAARLVTGRHGPHSSAILDAMTDSESQTTRALPEASEVATRVEDGPTAVVAGAPPPPGGSLGRYLVIEELGRGGMGVVLRAYDPKLQREVAIKLLRAGVLDATSEARMIHEARAMAKLSHPNVVAVYDVELGLASGVIVVMEYVAGGTLRQWLKAPRTWTEIIDAFIAAGRGLAAAHAKGPPPPRLQARQSSHPPPKRPPARRSAAIPRIRAFWRGWSFF
jgi:hypothetical protein